MFRGQGPCDGHHRGKCRFGLGQASHQVGGAGAVLAGQNHARPAAGPGVTVRHVSAGPLVMHSYESYFRGIVKRIEHLHGGRTNQAENMSHFFLLQRIDRGLTAGECLQFFLFLG